MRSGPITVLRTVRSARGLHGFLLFCHRTVFDAKRTVKVNGSRFFRSDRTVRSGFKNHGKEGYWDVISSKVGEVDSYSCKVY